MEAHHAKVITLPTLNVLGWFVGIVFDDHLDEVHALYNKPARKKLPRQPQ